MDEQVVHILRVKNAAAAVAWYQRLGFQKEWEHHFEPRLPEFVSVARGNVRLFLSEHTGDARPELRDPDGNRLRIGTPKSQS